MAGSVGLGGNSAITNSTGFATFWNFQAAKVGSYYVNASSGALSTVCSSFAICVASGGLNDLMFFSQPVGSVAAGTVPTTQPIVFATDIYGNALQSALIKIFLLLLIVRALLQVGSGLIGTQRILLDTLHSPQFLTSGLNQSI